MQPSTLSEQDFPDEDDFPDPRTLTLAQRHRRAAGVQEHRLRQNVYPRDPDDPQGRRRIRRQSPQRIARLLSIPRETASPCHHICVEHPTKHPNAFRYLYMLNPDNNGGARTFAWFLYAPAEPGGKGYGMLARTYSSVYEAVTTAARAGWLDASW